MAKKLTQRELIDAGYRAAISGDKCEAPTAREIDRAAWTQGYLCGKRARVRFEAEWIEKQHVDANGEWNPDRDEYACSYHATREEAEAAAIAGSKASGVEWIAVHEQAYRHGEWVDTCRWSGDWDGLHTRIPIVE